MDDSTETNKGILLKKLFDGSVSVGEFCVTEFPEALGKWQA